MARLGRIGHGLNIARKCLTLITIVILIMDAIGYLRSYYTDSSFDNKVFFSYLLIFELGPEVYKLPMSNLRNS